MHMLLAATEEAPRHFLITHPAAVLGVLLIVLAVVFRTSAMAKFRRFYAFVPAILLCYFIPSVLSTFGLVGDVPIHPQGKDLYWVASRFLLPACLVLLTITIDLPDLA